MLRLDSCAMRGLALVPILFLASFGSAAEEEVGEDEAVPPIFWIGETVSLASQRAKPILLEPGLYRVERTQGGVLQVRGGDSPRTIALPAEEVESDADDVPGGVRLVTSDSGTVVRYTGADGKSLQARFGEGEVRARSYWIPLYPDLRGSLELPEVVNWSSDFSVTVTLRNPGRGPASRIPFRVHLKDGSTYQRWASYVSDSSRYVSCSQDASSTVDCTYYGTVDVDASRSFQLRFASVAGRSSGNRRMDLHVDCSPSSWHSRGGAIRELSESNNVSWTEAWLEPKPNLRAGISSSIRRDGQDVVPKNQITRLNLTVTAVSPDRYRASGVKVVATLTAFDIHRVDSVGDFRCSFSNSTRKVTCTGGTLPTQTSSTSSTWQPVIRIHVMPRASTPLAPTPVMAHVDPDGRIAETNETDNLSTRNLYVTPR